MVENNSKPLNKKANPKINRTVPVFPRDISKIKFYSPSHFTLDLISLYIPC